MKRIYAIITASLLMLVVLSGCGFSRLEPGFVAVKIDYANNGQRTNIPAGGYISYNAITERVAIYPAGQQSLVMVRRGNEGKVTGDDSVEIRDAHGIPVHIDTTAFWRIDPTRVADMFQLRPGVPLVGPKADDLNDGIDDIVVRRIVRGVMQDVGAGYTYNDIFGSQRAKYTAEVSSLLGCDVEGAAGILGQEFIICDRFQMGEVYLDQAQQEAFSLQATAQQQAITAQAQVQTAVQNALAIQAKAEGDKQATIKAAEAQAESIRVVQEQLAKSPQYVEYLKATRWDGRLPQVQGSNATPFVQLENR